MNDVKGWLEALGLSGYAEKFIGQGIDFALLSGLSDADLRTIGVEALGHRKRLLRAIEDLKERSTAPTASNVPPAATAMTAPERRHLTVMFCDLVGSTAMATRLDPEDFQDVAALPKDAGFDGESIAMIRQINTFLDEADANQWLVSSLNAFINELRPRILRLMAEG